MLALPDEQAVAPITTSGGPPWAWFGVVFISLAAFPFLAWLVRKLVPGEEESRVNWGFAQVALVVLAGITAAVGAGLRMRAMLDADQEPTASQILTLSAISSGVPVLVAVIIALVRGPNGLAALGLRTGRWLRAPFAGLLVYILMLPALSATQIIWVWILEACGRTEFEQPLIDILAKAEPGERFGLVMIGVVIVPFFEELLFRGFLQPMLVQRLRPLGGIALTSVMFAILHGVEACVPIFALSCVLGYVMMRTQRLHAVWVIHAAHNGMQFLMLYAYPQYLTRAHGQ